jgi:S-formylglutathione hydrolase
MHSWWTDRICREFDPHLTAEKFVVDHVTPAVIERWGVTLSRVGLLGISMGGQGALRLAFKYPRRYPAVAAISAAIDYHELYGQGTTIDEMYDSKEQCRQDTAPLHIHPGDYPPHIFFCVDPTDRPWYRGNDRLHEKLSALGIPHEYDLTTPSPQPSPQRGEGANPTSPLSPLGRGQGEAGGHSWDYFNHMAERAIRFIHRGLSASARRLL